MYREAVRDKGGARAAREAVHDKGGARVAREAVHDCACWLCVRPRDQGSVNRGDESAGPRVVLSEGGGGSVLSLSPLHVRDHGRVGRSLRPTRNGQRRCVAEGALTPRVRPRGQGSVTSSARVAREAVYLRGRSVCRAGVSARVAREAGRVRGRSMCVA
jgi:hypothetical protein